MVGSIIIYPSIDRGYRTLSGLRLGSPHGTVVAATSHVHPSHGRGSKVSSLLLLHPHVSTGRSSSERLLLLLLRVLHVLRRGRAVLVVGASVHSLAVVGVLLLVRGHHATAAVASAVLSASSHRSSAVAPPTLLLLLHLLQCCRGPAAALPHVRGRGWGSREEG